MNATHKTDYQLKMLMKYNRDGSPDRQRARFQNLMRCVNHLQQKRGYGKRYKLEKFGKKEVSRLVNDWKEQGLSHRTIANRMVDIRWLASKYGHDDRIPSNKDIGLALRKNQPNYGINKSEELKADKLAQLQEREQLITRLRYQFGLRTAEACKFSHAYATKDSTDSISLKGSWCKGGRPREIPITNNEQRQLLTEIKAHQLTHGEKSMIPKEQSFKAYYRDYNEARYDVGIAGHGLRHQWAQSRFKELSGGIDCPLAGGAEYASLNQSDKLKWDKAASQVNQELGHGKDRQDITSTYIGSK
jgi:site-specific recombinase XerC